MWSLLALLTLSSAQASDASEATSTPEPPGLSDALAEVDDTYRRGRTLHRVGNIATGVGLGMVFTGVPIWASAGCSLGLLYGDTGCDLPIVAGFGTGLMVTGALTFASGPVLANVGALRVAGALRDRGADVDRTSAWVGLVYYGSAFVVGPLASSLVDTILRGNKGGDLAEELGVPVLNVLGIASGLAPVVALTMAYVQMSGPNLRGLLGLQQVALHPTIGPGTTGIAVRAAF